jgi:hypothetical protein
MLSDRSLPTLMFSPGIIGLQQVPARSCFRWTVDGHLVDFLAHGLGSRHFRSQPAIEGCQLADRVVATRLVKIQRWD